MREFGKGSKAHFVWRCGLCRRESSATFETASPPQPYKAENEEFGPLVTLECRGLEFIGFDPRACTYFLPSWRGSDANIHVLGCLEMRRDEGKRFRVSSRGR